MLLLRINLVSELSRVASAAALSDLQFEAAMKGIGVCVTVVLATMYALWRRVSDARCVHAQGKSCCQFIYHV